jgi:hypothetical protein
VFETFFGTDAFQPCHPQVTPSNRVSVKDNHKALAVVECEYLENNKKGRALLA